MIKDRPNPTIGIEARLRRLEQLVIDICNANLHQPVSINNSIYWSNFATGHGAVLATIKAELDDYNQFI